jgi:Flp pilus assembly protein TadG
MKANQIRRHRRSRGPRKDQRGQSMVEFALVFPLFMTILAVGIVASQFLSSVIGLNGAARAGAIAAANDIHAGTSYTQELTDATNAVSAEEGCTSCYTGVTDSTTCPANCVWITHDSGAQLGRSIETVHILHKVVPWVGLVKGISVQAQAGAEP